MLIKLLFPVSGVTSFKELAKTINGEVKTDVIELSLNPVNEVIKHELYMDSGNYYKGLNGFVKLTGSV